MLAFPPWDWRLHRGIPGSVTELSHNYITITTRASFRQCPNHRSEVLLALDLVITWIIDVDIYIKRPGGGFINNQHMDLVGNVLQKEVLRLFISHQHGGGEAEGTLSDCITC